MIALNDYLEIFKGHKLRDCVSDALFFIPFLRNIFVWTLASSVSKTNINHLLQTGYSPAVCSGGAHEVVYMQNNKEVILYLRKRVGLVKLAMKHGTPIIPSFAFGQRKLYDFYVPNIPVVHRFCRKIGFVPLIFSGVFSIPFGPPKPSPITVVIGASISIPKHANPSEESLQEYENKIITALEDIFETHKEAYGMHDYVLKII